MALIFGIMLFGLFLWLLWYVYKKSKEPPEEPGNGHGRGGPGRDPDDNSGLPPLPSGTHIPSYVPAEWVDENLEALAKRARA